MTYNEHLHPLISIIIPVYNRETLIIETLNSISKQTFKNWECIIIDDNSTDKTYKIVESYSKKDNRFIIINKPPNINKGPSSSRNFGFSNSSGSLVHFFDSDDLLSEDFYEQVVSGSFNIFFDFQVTRVCFFVKNLEKIETSPIILNNDFIIKGIVGDHSFYTSNIIWKRDFLEKTGVKFNDKLSMCEDLDFDVRNFLSTDNYIIRNDLFINIRKHSESLTGSTEEKWLILREKDMLLVFKSLSKLLQKKKVYNTYVAKYITKFCNFLIHDLLRHGYIGIDVFRYFLFVFISCLNPFMMYYLLKYTYYFFIAVFRFYIKYCLYHIAGKPSK